MKSQKIHVSTYAGYKADERPLSFIFEGKKHTIKEIMCQTNEEILDIGLRRTYTVKTDEGFTHKLHYDEDKEQWFLEE